MLVRVVTLSFPAQRYNQSLQGVPFALAESRALAPINLRPCRHMLQLKCDGCFSVARAVNGAAINPPHIPYTHKHMESGPALPSRVGLLVTRAIDLALLSSIPAPVYHQVGCELHNNKGQLVRGSSNPSESVRQITKGISYSELPSLFIRTRCQVMHSLSESKKTIGSTKGGHSATR